MRLAPPGVTSPSRGRTVSSLQVPITFDRQFFTRLLLLCEAVFDDHLCHLVQQPVVELICLPGPGGDDTLQRGRQIASRSRHLQDAGHFLEAVTVEVVECHRLSLRRTQCRHGSQHLPARLGLFDRSGLGVFGAATAAATRDASSVIFVSLIRRIV